MGEGEGEGEGAGASERVEERDGRGRATRVDGCIATDAASVPHPARVRNAHRLITFADAFDPLLFENNRTARGLAGRVCVLGASNPEPLSCSTCFAHSCPSSRSYPCRINITEPACNLCFRLRHVYGHYFHDDIPLAENAVCSIRTPCQASENACASLGACPAAAIGRSD